MRLAPADDGREVALHANQTRGSAFNAGWLGNAVAREARIVFTQGGSREVLKIYDGGRGRSSIVTPLEDLHQPLAPGT